MLNDQFFMQLRCSCELKEIWWTLNLREAITMRKILSAILLGTLIILCAGCSSGKDDAAPTYTISGTVTSSGSALSGVTISLTGTSTIATTGTDGTYTISGLANGSYTVTPSLANYTFSPTNTAVVVNGSNILNINFAATKLVEPEDGQGGGSSTCNNTWGFDDGSYKGIISHSNANSDCTHYDGDSVGTYGYEWQCVEYVNRFYIEALNHTGYTCGPPPNYTPDHMKGCGNAVNYYANYQQLALSRYPNGGTVPPRPDDILVFSQLTKDGLAGFGHVAIVTGTLYDANGLLTGITIIQQNWYDNYDDVGKFLPICQNPNLDPSLDCSKMTTGSYYFAPNVLMPKSGTFTVLGWLRKPGTLTPQLSVATASGTPGTTFVLSGIGFSANSSVTTHLQQPDGTELPTSTSSTNSNGNYSYNVDSSSFVPGNYSAWGVDNTTNAVSNRVGFKVVSQQGVITLALINLINPNTVYSPQKLCQDNNYIYWTGYAGSVGGSLNKVLKSGGNVINIISGLSNPSGLSDPTYIAVDSSNIYWIDLGTANGTSGIINKIPFSLQNWNITTLANGQSVPIGIAVDGSYVYWAEYHAGTIKRVPINGGTIETLASGLSDPSSVAVDANYVYWTEDTGSVKKVNKSDKSVTVLASGLCSPYYIRIDSSNVYWSDGAYGPSCGVRQISKNGGTITPLALNLAGGITGIATDGTYVYYIVDVGTGTSDSIMKIPVGGGSPVLVVGNLDHPVDVVVDGTYVYWIEQGNTTRRVAKIAK
jgi:hypothetical protein